MINCLSLNVNIYFYVLSLTLNLIYVLILIYHSDWCFNLRHFVEAQAACLWLLFLLKGKPQSVAASMQIFLLYWCIGVFLIPPIRPNNLGHFLLQIMHPRSMMLQPPWILIFRDIVLFGFALYVDVGYWTGEPSSNCLLSYTWLEVRFFFLPLCFSEQ